MTHSNAQRLAKQLACADWKWDLTSVCQTLAEKGWKHIKDSGHRSEYLTPEGYSASVYHSEGKVELVEAVLEAFVDVASLDEVSYEDKVDEYYQKFNDATKAITAILGKPAFSDGAAARGFPEDQDAAWLSIWDTHDARFMIAQKHEDREVPFRLCFQAAPPA